MKFHELLLGKRRPLLAWLKIAPVLLAVLPGRLAGTQQATEQVPL